MAVTAQSNYAAATYQLVTAWPQGQLNDAGVPMASINDASQTQPCGVPFIDICGNQYMYVLNDDTGTATQGYAVGVNWSYAYCANGIIAVQAGTGDFAGIWISAPASGNFGWIQTKGYTQVAVTLTSSGSWAAGVYGQMDTSNKGQFAYDASAPANSFIRATEVIAVTSGSAVANSLWFKGVL